MGVGRRLVAGVALVVVAVSCSDDATWTVPDRDFVAAMIPHHHLGMTLVDEATRHSADVRLRRLVFEMSGYHQSELDTLSTWAERHDIATATDFPGDLPAADVGRLDVLDGAAHDIWWLDLMVRHHRGAVQMADAALTSGRVDEVRTLAEMVRHVQTDEITQMEELRATLCAEQPEDSTTAGC